MRVAMVGHRLFACLRATVWGKELVRVSSSSTIGVRCDVVLFLMGGRSSETSGINVNRYLNNIIPMRDMLNYARTGARVRCSDSKTECDH